MRKTHYIFYQLKIVTYFIFITLFVVLFLTSCCTNSSIISDIPENALPSEIQRFLLPASSLPRFCPMEIIFDQSKEQVFSPWDTGFMGYSKLTLMLQQSGFWVSANNRPLGELLQNLSKNCVLVLGVAKGHSSYTDVEISATKKFVEQGGSLLIIGEHENMYGCGDFQNPLLEQFGFRFEPVAIERKGAMGKSFEVDDFWPWFFCSTWDISDIRFFLSGSITISDSGEALIMTDESTQPEKAVPAAWKQIDKGKVVACADAEFLWNGNQEMGIDVGNNREFAKRIMNWLAKKNVPKRKVFESAIEQKKPIQGRVLFDLWHNGRGLEHSQSGLYQLARAFEKKGYQVFFTHQSISDYKGFSLVIVPCPLSQDPMGLSQQGKRLSESARKVLLLGEAHSSFQAIMRHDAAMAKATLFADFQDSPAPLNSIAEHLGVTFPAYTFMSPEKNHFHAKADWGKNKITISRAGVVQPLAENKLKILAKGEKGTWGELLLFIADQPDTLSKDSFSYDPGKGDLATPAIALGNKQLMAIGTLDLFTNAGFLGPDSQLVFQQILQWL